MNEKIKQLAAQAGYSDSWDAMLEVDLEKFAELMIKECALVIQDLVDQRVPASEYPSRMIAHFAKLDHGD